MSSWMLKAHTSQPPLASAMPFSSHAQRGPCTWRLCSSLAYALLILWEQSQKPHCALVVIGQTHAAENFAWSGVQAGSCSLHCTFDGCPLPSDGGPVSGSVLGLHLLDSPAALLIGLLYAGWHLLRSAWLYTTRFTHSALTIGPCLCERC